jgi:predicted enzyme involved in methoxymalonyl-ACP biosynthesis
VPELRGNAAPSWTKAGNYDEYLSRSHVARVVALRRARSRADRAAINKSNQFNLTTRRYDEEDVPSPRRTRTSRWQATDRYVRCARHDRRRDRAQKSDEWLVDTWLQSCRVLSRGVEQTPLNELVRLARVVGVGGMAVRANRAERHGRGLYPRLGFASSAPADGRKRFVCMPAAFIPLKSFIDPAAGDLPRTASHGHRRHGWYNRYRVTGIDH